MSQTEMERELAQQTGESIHTIRHRGFQLMEVLDSSPQLVDWDDLDQQRVSYLPQRSRTSIRNAA